MAFPDGSGRKRSRVADSDNGEQKDGENADCMAEHTIKCVGVTSRNA